MTRALEQVLEEFLRDEADQIPRTAGSPYERFFSPRRQLPARRLRQLSRRQLVRPIGAAAAVIALVTGAVMISGPRHANNAVNPAGAAPSIPARISIPATVSSVLDHPMPRAALLVQTGTDADPNAVSSDPILVSPDGLAYRMLPTVVDGAVPGTVSLSAFALSPDGTLVAYGDWTRDAPASSALHVVDLASGQVSTFAMPGSGKGEQIGNVTWSPDGTRIAYSAASITVLPTTGPGEGQATQDDAILDLATGRVTPLPATPFAWSADGQQLLLGPPYATGTMYPETNALEIVDSAARIVRTIPTGSLLDVQLGAGMWSSAAHAIATVVRAVNPDDSSSQPHDSWSEPHQYTLQLMPDQPGQQVTASQLNLGSLVGVASVVGWLDADHVAVSERLPDQAMRIVSVDIDTGASIVMTQATSSRVTNIQVASVLLASQAQDNASHGISG